MQVLYLYAMGVILSPFVAQAAQKRFMLEIQNVTCQSFTNHFKHLECTYQKVANGKYLFNIDFMYDRKFGKDIDMHLRLRVRPLKGKTSINFIDLRVNVCAITSQAFKNGFLQKVFNEVLRTSNLPLDCGFKENIMYKLDNCPLTDDFIPSYAPFLNATYSIRFFQDNQRIADYIVSAALISRA